VKPGLRDLNDLDALNVGRPALAHLPWEVSSTTGPGAPRWLVVGRYEPGAEPQGLGTGRPVIADCGSAGELRARWIAAQPRIIDQLAAELAVAREEIAASRRLLDDYSASEADAERYAAARAAYDRVVSP
jgi:hypothetical protein